MHDPDMWLAIAFLTALAVVLAACWMLHRRLRTPRWSSYNARFITTPFTPRQKTCAYVQGSL